MDTARTATGAGAGALQQVAVGVRQSGDSLDGFAFLPQGSCALVYARGGGSIVDLDLFAFADDGTQYGADEAPDDLPTLLFCAETRSERIFLTAKVAHGQGPVAIALHDVPVEDRQRLIDLVGARQKVSKMAPDAQAWPSLNEKVSEHLKALGGAWRDVRRVALPIDARVPTRLDAQVPPERCLDVLAVPEDDYLQLEVTVTDQNGRILTRGTEHEDTRYLIFCADKRGGNVHLEFRPQSGQGLVLVALSSSTQPGTQLDFPSDLVNVIVLGVPRSSPSLADPKVTKSKPFALQTGEIHNHPLQLNGCARYSIVDDVTGDLVVATARAWNKRGELLAESRNHFGDPLFVCHTGALQLELESDQRVSAARLLSIPIPKQYSELTALPLAASRALSRFDALHPTKKNDANWEVTELKLEPNQLHTVPLALPPHTCLTVAVGVTASGGWVEMRARDTARQAILSRAWGKTSAGLELCATSVALDAVVEIRSEQAPSGAVFIKSK